MTLVRVSGGFPLDGEITIQGSKNAVLPVMAAALLIPGETRLFNCPDIADVRAMAALLQKLGARVAREEDMLVIDALEVKPFPLNAKDMADTRGCILLLGALMARFLQAELAYPGGCVIGRRPVNLHLKALQALGADVQEGEQIVCTAKKLCGSEICFPVSSVGATQNALLAAVFAEGTTRICNAAKEPEVVQLCEFLNRAGARIKGVGTAYLTVCGVTELKPVAYRVPSDRIVAGTYMTAVLLTGGNVFLKNADASELCAVTEPLKRAGGEIFPSADGILVKGSGRLMAFDYIKTEPYPGFPTDMQSQFLVLAAAADGVSIIEETIFEARFGIVSELKKMGARIYLDENKAVIEGIAKLQPAVVCGKDLRGTASLMIAALAAKGESVVSGYEYLERGYENFLENLNELGARVKKEQ